MRRFRRIGLSLVLAVAMLVAFAIPAAAVNPTVTITMSAQILLITNTHNAWAVGALTAGHAAVYFSVDNDPDVAYSQILNTGNVATDVAIQGTNAVEQGVPSTYNWTLVTGPAAGNQTFSLYANTEGAPTVYSIEVATGGTAWIDELAEDDTYDWSMKLTPPTAFHPNDDGDDKVCTVTLVASKD